MGTGGTLKQRAGALAPADPPKMRVVVGKLRHELIEEDLRFVRQVGASGVVLNRLDFSKLPGGTFTQIGAMQPVDESSGGVWQFMDLLHLRTTVESHGMRLEALENVPLHFYDHIMLGGPKKAEQLANMQACIRNMGQAGIPVLGYHWMPSMVWRTSRSVLLRGGARSTGFDYDLVRHAPHTHGREIGEEELWENYRHFIQAVLPVAEDSGVTLALHPDDPPVPSLGGVARIMRSRAAFERALNLGDSPNHGLEFCLGSWSEMGIDVVEALRHFGSQGKLVYLHFRDVAGSVPAFHETFLGEGNVNLFEALRTLREVGFTGFLMDDHVPELAGDTPWGHRAKGWAVGYMLGLLNALEQTPPAVQS